MDKLMRAIKRKKLSDRLTNIIISLFDESVKFWGLDKKDLIIDTIEKFHIVCVDNLPKKIEEVSGGKVNRDGVGKNNLGLCEIIPIVENQKIVNVRNVILLDNSESDKELSSILSHELFFHGVKSIIQPYMSENILMQGLDAHKFVYDINDKLIDVQRTGGRGLEEISTYFGQNMIMKNIYGQDIEGDYLFLDIVNSVGKILMETTLGKLILEAQINKNVFDLCKRFEETEDNRLMLTGENNRVTWKDYNRLMDKFMELFGYMCMIEEKDNRFEKLTKEYIEAYYQLSNLNIGIFFATLLLDSNDVSKKRQRDI